MRTLDTAQTAAVTGPVTEPQYLVEIQLDQPYYWTTRGVKQFDGNTYILGGVKIGTVSAKSAELMVDNSDYRHTMNALTGIYQRNTVKIYWAPGPYVTTLDPYVSVQYVQDDYWPYDYVNANYWAPGYVDQGASAIDPLLLFEGVIYATPLADNWLSVRAERTPPRLYPFTKIRPPLANFLPPDGYIVQFDGTVLRIENG